MVWELGGVGFGWLGFSWGFVRSQVWGLKVWNTGQQSLAPPFALYKTLK